jgi:DNA polymerase III alpha subunit
MEDEAGMINAILRPDVYERDRVAVRGEPFLWIIGTLAKDDGTVNIIAEEVRALTVRRKGGQTDRRKGTSPTDPATLPPYHSAPTNRESTNPYRFLRSMRQLAPGSKDWG